MRSEITISDVRLKRKGVFNPIIVEFLNGDVAEEKLSTVKAKLVPHENFSERAVVITTPDKQKYVNEPVHKLIDSKFIAVRNRKTNKVRLVEVDFTRLVNTLCFKNEKMTADVIENKEQIGALRRLFGTKRAVRRLEQREALEFDRSHVENQINELMESIPAAEPSLLNDSLNKTTSEIDKECLSNLIPPCHRDATTVFDVYKVEDCISEMEISSLTDGIEEILSNRKNLQNQSQFLQAHLPGALSTTENVRVRLACLLFAEALVNYLKTQAKALGKAATTLCPHSKTIGEKIIREFCVKTGSSVNRPLIMKDKAVCYIIVLTLIACGYEIDLEPLAKITSYGYKKMLQLGRIVGMVPAGKKTSVHTLVVPLPAPVKMVKKSRATPRK